MPPLPRKTRVLALGACILLATMLVLRLLFR